MLISHVLKGKGGQVHTLSAEATLAEAARELDVRRVGALVVTDESGRLTGVFSERDLVREVGRRGAACLHDKVSSAMTRGVITASMDETVDEGLERMTDRRIRHLPVVDDGRLIGIVSIGDLVKLRIARAEAEAAAMQAYISAG
ncbi:MAG: CBS domain-containing protein [Caulobacterales bacterium]|jgi:CBS domain-containing protein